MSDPRPDEMLAEHGRIASRLGLALAWTDGISGGAAKECSRNGAAAWKNAQPLSRDEQAAAGFFAKRARTRNPAVVASASGLVLIENDGGEELLDRFGLAPLPLTVVVRSRRGLHRYYRPPADKPPLKVQLDPSSITVSSDGYLVGAPALHPDGWTYCYESGVDRIAELTLELYELIEWLGQQTREQTARTFAAGGPIPTGQRSETMFHLALEQLRAGQSSDEILERLLDLNRDQCGPPLEERLVRKQLAGAVTWARKHPTEQEKLRAKARHLLEQSRSPTERPKVGPTPWGERKRALERRSLRSIRPERVEWAIEGIIPLRTLSMVVGVGGLGKSALALVYAKQVTDRGGKVLVISYEDGAAQVIRPRFEALGGNLDLHPRAVRRRTRRRRLVPDRSRRTRPARARDEGGSLS